MAAGDTNAADMQNSQPDSWARSIWGGLIEIGKVAVQNLTGQNQTQVTQPVPPAQTADKLDVSKIVIIAVAVVGGIFVLKMLTK